jgi:hypothetical protein
MEDVEVLLNGFFNVLLTLHTREIQAALNFLYFLLPIIQYLLDFLNFLGCVCKRFRENLDVQIHPLNVLDTLIAHQTVRFRDIAVD